MDIMESHPQNPENFYQGLYWHIIPVLLKCHSVDCFIEMSQYRLFY